MTSTHTASRRRCFDNTKLRAAREELGMNRAVLARAANVHYDQLKRYEVGKSEPTVGVADALAAALGIPIEAFLSVPITAITALS